MRRSGKYYRRNEADVMHQLGLRPTKNSGSGWVEKEDGQSEDLICQLKSTDAQSIKVSKQDLDTLQYNAAVAHKLPLFAIQYLSSGEVYLVLKPEVLLEVAEYLNTGERRANTVSEFVGIELGEHEEAQSPGPRRVVKSNSAAREAFHKEGEERYKKGKKSAI